MAAAKKNLTIEQGATFKKRFLYRDRTRTPIDLTGYSAQMQIRTPQGVLLVDMSTDNGKIILSAVPGGIDLLIAVEETSTLDFTSALYDLKLIAPDGTHVRLLEGMVSVSLAQTKP